MKLNRLTFYDVLKCYAIFLVVLGHVIQTFNPMYRTNDVFLVIYMFHMPLFIAISGYFFVKSAEKRTAMDLVKRRFVNIMLPSLTMGFFNVIIIGGGKILRHKSLDFFYLTDLLFTGLWFLTTLFILTVIGTLLYKKVDRKYFYIIWFVVWLVFYVLPDVWVFNQIEFLLPFYVLGIVCRNIKFDKLNIFISMIALVVFGICFLNFTFDNTMYAMGRDCFSLNYLYGTLFRIICGASGIICSIALVKFAIRVFSQLSVLSTVGTMTLPIYVLHQKLLIVNMFLNYYTGSVFVFGLIALMVICITVMVYKLLRKNKYLALFLFGEMQKQSIYGK